VSFATEPTDLIEKCPGQKLQALLSTR